MATRKQKAAVKQTLENVGKPMGAILKEVGYKDSIVKNPQIVTKSKGWIELMEEYLPDTLLAEKHKELLTVPIKIRVKNKGLMTIETEELDTFAISRGLDMAYKIKGTYAPEKNFNVNINQNIPDEQVDKLAEELIKRMKDGEQNNNKGTDNTKS